jgi:hypothetical protein
MPFLNWVTGTDLNFLPFETADLSIAPSTGVYVIYVIGSTHGKAVKVGFGDVANLIAADRIDQEILDFRKIGKLQITWAETTRAQMSGIARHLSDILTPALRIVGLFALPIEVNLPGSPVVSTQLNQGRSSAHSKADT